MYVYINVYINKNTMFSILNLAHLENILEKNYGYYNMISIHNEKIGESVIDKICEIFNLETLILCDCGIEKIPDKIFKIPTLKTLDLSDNPITEIPKSILECTNLNLLEINNTKISVLPKWMEQLQLKHLSLRACVIDSINFDITKIDDVNIDIDTYLDIHNLSNDCEYIQINYLSVTLNNLPISLKKIKLISPKLPIDVKVPFGCDLIIESR